MANENAKNEMPAISFLIEQRLKALSVAQQDDVMAHPDEDTITAFVESRLGAEEASPVVSHLIVCGLCRRMTAQLARLETALGEIEEPLASEEPTSRISSFLDGIASRLVPSSGEDVVFAYQNPDDQDEVAAEETGSKEKGSGPTGSQPGETDKKN